MKYKNSFFRVDIKEDGTYLDLYPPKQDGKSLDLKEIIDFLDRKKVPDFSIDTVKNALLNLKDEIISVKLSEEKMDSFPESALITVSKDKMIAYIRFYPPSSGGKVMDKKEILGELEHEKIKYGIIEKVLDVFCVARQYCLNIPIAKGVKPILATDTKIDYFFNAKPLAKPKVLEDGSVDFHELNLFTKVNKGDVLAKLTMHKMGEPGRDVYGNVIPQNKPKISKLKYGKNISISEDKTVLTSEVDGNVSLTNGMVFVSDTFNVAADVDASTGDIDFDGSVCVAGTVKTGFTVKAKGDIQVNGVVEGATLIAGGNIVIKRGVQGMGKGNLQCDGDICAQFFESANVRAGGNVTAGSILHSNIVSGGKVIVSGKKGFIVGGEVVCESYVEVHSIGNKMETQTHIKVGVKPELYDEMKKLISETSDLKAQIEEVSSYLNVYKVKLQKGAKLTPENLKQIRERNAVLEELNGQRNEKNIRLREIRELIDVGKNGSVKVTGSCYRGVTIFLATHIYSVKDRDDRCVYKIVDGEAGPTNY